MSEYRRPSISVEIFFDEDGLAIDYGFRWRGESPPEDAYSRLTNQHRFAPLHGVASALVDWLRETYEVSVEDGPGTASDLLRIPDEVIRSIRVVPREPAAAPLTFVFTGYPGIFLHAGVLHDFHFPFCGCDACDDDVAELAEQLEWTVRTVVSGGYSESIDLWPHPWVKYRVDEPGVAMRSGRSRDVPRDRLKSARAALPRAGRWVPWPTLAQGHTPFNSGCSTTISQ